LLDQLFRIDGLVAVVSDSGACSSPDVVPLLMAAGTQVVLADKDAAGTESRAGIDPQALRSLPSRPTSNRGIGRGAVHGGPVNASAGSTSWSTALE
jgi:hypothetical protein